MSTIITGNSSWETIDPGRRIELTASGSALVVMYGQKVGAPAIRTVSMVTGESRTFGPYLRPIRLQMSALTGDINYQELEGDAAGEDAQPLSSLDGHVYGDTAAALLGSAYPGSALPNWSASVAKVRAGTADALVGFFGESTTVGTGAGSGGGLIIGARPKSPPALFVKRLQEQGIPASEASFFGEHAIQTTGGDFAAYDTRLAKIGGATNVADGSFLSLGGIPWQINSSGKAIGFTPTETCDRADVFYLVTSACNITPTFASGATTPSSIVEASATTQVKKVTLSFTRGTGELRLTWASGNMVLIGVRMYDSTTPAVHAMNFGINGFRADQLSTTTGPSYSTIAAAAATLGLSLAFIDMSINSAALNGLAGIAAWKGNISTFVAALRAVNCDVVLVTPAPTGTASPGLNGVLAAYAQAGRALAVELGLPLCDMYARWGSYAAKDALGYYADPTHPGGVGYQDKSAALTASVRV